MFDSLFGFAYLYFIIKKLPREYRRGSLGVILDSGEGTKPTDPATSIVSYRFSFLRFYYEFYCDLNENGVETPVETSVETSLARQPRSVRRVLALFAI